MRKLLIIACLLSIAFAGFSQKKKKASDKTNPVAADAPDTVNYKMTGAPMPHIRLVFPGGQFITEENVANNANLFIVMFNPLCEHCQDETRLLEQNIKLFKKSNIILMASPNMMQMLDYFESGTNVSEYPKLMVGIDSAGFMDRTRRYENLPYINIYNSDRRLIKMFNGDVPIDSLKPYIE